MAVTLYVVAASHPCFAAARALELKRIPYRRVEWPPVMHAAIQRALFGERTVPALSLDGERIVGSRPIMHRLDELQPEPPLYPDPRVEEADRWGDEVLQPIPRRVVWWAFRRHPAAIRSFAANSRIPLAGPTVKALVPVIAPISWHLNEVDDEAVRRDVEALPEHLDRVDRWIGQGVLGGDPPNAADLQIGASIALLRMHEDLEPLIRGRPAAQLAAHFPTYRGRVPAGVLTPVVDLPA